MLNIHHVRRGQPESDEGRLGDSKRDNWGSILQAGKEPRELNEVHGRELSVRSKVNPNSVLRIPGAELYRSKSQYELRLRQWGIHKNHKQDERRIISAKVKHRKQQGKKTEVIDGSQLIPPETLRKHMSRYPPPQPYQPPLRKFSSHDISKHD